MKFITDSPEWVSFYKGFNSSMYVEKASHFDERPQIHTSATQLATLFMLPFLCLLSIWFMLLLPFVFFGWGKLYINLPIRTGIQDCESAAWGFNYHDNKIWIYIGGGGNFEGGKKWKTITMPWNYDWVRTSKKCSDGNWEHDTKIDRKEFWQDKWKGVLWESKHLYSYTLKSGEVQHCTATIQVRQQEWRMKLLKWTSLFAKISNSIDIEFSKEVGEETGGWKGGCIGCSWELLPNEKPYDALKRMESVRRF